MKLKKPYSYFLKICIIVITLFVLEQVLFFIVEYVYLVITLNYFS